MTIERWTNDELMTIWWRFDDDLMTIWWRFDDDLTIAMKRKIDKKTKNRYRACVKNELMINKFVNEKRKFKWNNKNNSLVWLNYHHIKNFRLSYDSIK